MLDQPSLAVAEHPPLAKPQPASVACQLLEPVPDRVVVPRLSLVAARTARQADKLAQPGLTDAHLLDRRPSRPLDMRKRQNLFGKITSGVDKSSACSPARRLKQFSSTSRVLSRGASDTDRSAYFAFHPDTRGLGAPATAAGFQDRNTGPGFPQGGDALPLAKGFHLQGEPSSGPLVYRRTTLFASGSGFRGHVIRATS